MKIEVSEQALARARSIASSAHAAMVASYSFNGSAVKPLPAIALRDTIISELVDPGELVRLQLVYPEDGPDDIWRASCEALLGQGLEHRGRRYGILGASSSLKKGNVWLATTKVRERLLPFFGNAQEALAYLGILFSGCHHGVHRLEDVRAGVVDDGDHATADGMGYVSRDFLRRMDLPERQIQVRFVGDQPGASWLGKGTCLPKDMDQDFILPKSMIKGAGSPPDGPLSCWFGVREIARTRPYRSSFTYAQWFGDDVLDAVSPVVNARLEVIKGALSSRENALRFLGLMHGEDALDPARSKAEAFLEAGIAPTHPWLQRQLRQMMRRSFVDLALGGGIELTGRMGAWADLPDNVVCVPDLPAGPAVLSRYPIRDPHSFIAVWNEPDAVEDAPVGSIFLNNRDCIQLDGDYDGDIFTVCTQPAVVDAVTSLGWYPDYRREDVPPKTRRRDPIEALPYVAVESLGSAIGTYSYAIAGALHAGEPDRIAPLSAALQAEVQAIKWDTRGDRSLLKDDALVIPQFIADAKTDRDLFVHHAESVEGDTPLVRQYNRIVAAWTHDLPATRPLLHFKAAMPVWVEPGALVYVEEAAAVVQVFNRWITSILKKSSHPTQAELEGPLSFLRAWDASKTDDRRAWAVALWHVVHGSRADTTGSAAFHAFSDEATTLIAETAGLMPPVRQAAGNADYRDDAAEDGEVAAVPSLTVIPLVGAWRRHQQNGDDGLLALRRLKGDELVTVSVHPGKEHGPAFFAGDMYLGSVPSDHLIHGSVQPGIEFTARLTTRGKTVYLIPDRRDWFAPAPTLN